MQCQPYVVICIATFSEKNHPLFGFISPNKVVAGKDLIHEYSWRNLF